jgi:hypothetical protein
MVVGFLVRVIGQPTVPYGFHRDEAAIGYSAYSVLFTARDECCFHHCLNGCCGCSHSAEKCIANGALSSTRRIIKNLVR